MSTPEILAARLRAAEAENAALREAAQEALSALGKAKDGLTDTRSAGHAYARLDAVLGGAEYSDCGWLEEGRRLVMEARSAQGPAIEHLRSAAETWFWANTHRLFQPPARAPSIQEEANRMQDEFLSALPEHQPGGPSE